MNKFDHLNSLAHRVALYVPSKILDHHIDNTFFVSRIRESFVSLFGGCTVTEGTGAWFNDEPNAVDTEHVSIVYAFADFLPDERLDALCFLAQELAASMNQVAVSVEVDNKLYFVQQQTN